MTGIVMEWLLISLGKPATTEIGVSAIFDSVCDLEPVLSLLLLRFKVIDCSNCADWV